MALDVSVHDRFEVLEFAVLEKVDDVDLEMNTSDGYNKEVPFYVCTFRA